MALDHANLKQLLRRYQQADRDLARLQAESDTTLGTARREKDEAAKALAGVFGSAPDFAVRARDLVDAFEAGVKEGKAAK